MQAEIMVHRTLNLMKGGQDFMTNPIDTIKANKKEKQRMKELLQQAYEILNPIIKEKYNLTEDCLYSQEFNYMPHSRTMYIGTVYDWFDLDIRVYYNTWYDSCTFRAIYDNHEFSLRWTMDESKIRDWVDELDRKIRLCIPDKYLDEFEKVA